MEFPNGKFSFTVASTSAKPPKTHEPQLTVVANNKGKFKLNEAGSKLVDLKPGEYMAFVNNKVQVDAAIKAYKDGDEETVAWVDENGGIEALKVQWGIAKGWVLLDKGGKEQTSRKPLTNAESKALEEAGEVDEAGKVIAPLVPAHKGSRLNAKSLEVKIGLILDGTDSTNCPILRDGIADDEHAVYAISKESMAVQFPNGNTQTDVTIYPITLDGTEKKIERNKG